MLSRFFLKVFFVCLATNVVWVSAVSAETKNTTEATEAPAEAGANSGEVFKSVVPALVGLTLDEASTLLPQYDLSLGTVTEKSDTAKVGTITTQSSAANSEVDRWSVIDVTIAVSSTESQPLAAPIGAASTPVETPEPTTPAEAPATSNENAPLIPEIPFNTNTDAATNTAKSADAAKEETAKPAENAAASDQPTPAPAANTAEPAPAVPKAEETPKDPLAIPASSFKVEEEKKAEEPAKTEETKTEEEAKPAGDVVKPDTSAVETPAATPETSEAKPEETKQEESEPETAAASSSSSIPASEEKPAAETSGTSSSDTESSASSDDAKTSEDSVAEQDSDTEIKGLTTTVEKEDEKKAESKPKQPARPSYPQATKVSLSMSPSDVQVTRDIAMTIEVNPPLKGDAVYQFNISGKTYNSKTPEFTHVFDKEKSVIVTGSARILGKPWLHSASKRVKVGKYVARKIKVPKIVGLSESEAKALLESKGLLVGNIQDKIVKDGKGVIKQMPTAGTIRTEDDNKIHYVRAVDEKYKVRIASELPAGPLEAGTSVIFKVKVRPLPSSGKVRYRFMVGDKAYNSKSSTWSHSFSEAGDMTVKAQAIIDGQGMFESASTTVSVVGEWKKPTAVITPFTVSVAQGETASFESVSTYDSRSEVELTWKNLQGDASKGTSLAVDTKALEEGEHAVSLTVKDERGFEHTAKAQLIITASADTAKEDENKEAAAEQLNSDDAAGGDKQADSKPTELALDEATQSALAAEAAATSTEQPKVQMEATPEAKPVAAEKPEEVLTLKTEDAKALEAAQAGASDAASQSENTGDVQATAGGASVDAQTVSDTNDDTSWGMWLWLTMIAIVLLPILWILGKLRNKPTAPQSPSFESPAMKGSDDIIAKRTPQPVVTSSKRRDPKLTDFDLDVKPAESKSKKDELTNFKLDDDK